LRSTRCWSGACAEQASGRSDRPGSRRRIEADLACARIAVRNNHVLAERSAFWRRDVSVRSARGLEGTGHHPRRRGRPPVLQRRCVHQRAQLPPLSVLLLLWAGVSRALPESTARRCTAPWNDR
jgi:hypothetical protein